MTRRRILRGSLSLDEYQHYTQQTTVAFTRLLEMDTTYDMAAVAAVLDAASTALHDDVPPAKIASAHMVNKTLMAFFNDADVMTDTTQTRVYQKIQSHMNDAGMRRKIFDAVCDYHVLSL